MGHYAICENGYHGRLPHNKRWIVWDTRNGCEVGKLTTLTAALMLVAALHSELIAWSEM